MLIKWKPLIGPMATLAIWILTGGVVTGLLAFLGTTYACNPISEVKTNLIVWARSSVL